VLLGTQQQSFEFLDQFGIYQLILEGNVQFWAGDFLLLSELSAVKNMQL
jgi:hypothetical protein